MDSRLVCLRRALSPLGLRGLALAPATPEVAAARALVNAGGLGLSPLVPLTFPNTLDLSMRSCSSMSSLLTTTLRVPDAAGSERLESSARRSGFESSMLRKSSISAASSGGLPSFRNRLEALVVGTLLDVVSGKRPSSCWRIMVPSRDERLAATAAMAGLPAAPNESRLAVERLLKGSGPVPAPAVPTGHSAEPAEDPVRPYDLEAVYEP